MGLGGVASLAGSLISNSTANNAQEAAAAATQKAVDAINAVGASPDLAKQIFLQQFKSAGILTPEVEQNINTHFQQIAGPSSQVTGAQSDVLNKLAQQSAGGLTPQDRLALAQIQQQGAKQNQAAQGAIMQNLAERGLTGRGTSGAEIAQRLMSQQNSANNENMQGLQIGANSAQEALQALAAEGGQANTMNQQQFGQNAANANIANEQNRFNTQNQIAAQQRNVANQNAAKQYNLANTQQLSNANVSNANAEAQREVQAQQQMYQNAMNHAGQIANAYTGQANNLINAGKDKAGAQAGLFGGLASTAAGVGNYLNNKNQFGQLMTTLDGNASANPSTGSYGTVPINFNTSGVGNIGADSNGSLGNQYSLLGQWQGGPVPNYEHGGYVGNTIPAGYDCGGTVDMRNGGNVPGTAKVPGDSPLNDTVPAMLSPGEYVVPRSEMAKMNEETPSSGGKDLDYSYLKSLLYTHKTAHKHLKKMNSGGRIQLYNQGGPAYNKTDNSFDQNGIMAGYADGGGVSDPSEMDYGSSVPVGTNAPIPVKPLPKDISNPLSFDDFLKQYEQTKASSELAKTAPMSNNLDGMNLPQNSVGGQVQAALQNKLDLPVNDTFSKAPENTAKTDEDTEEDSDESKPSKTPETKIASFSEQKSQKNTPDYLGAMKAAMGASNLNSLNANLLKGYQQALGAAGRRPADYSLADSLEKQANVPIEQLEHGIKFQDQTQKMEFNKEMDDPNSKTSQFTQAIAVKYGIDPKKVEGVPASALSKLIPALGTASYHEALINSKNTLGAAKNDKSNATSQEHAVNQTQNLLESSRSTPDVKQAYTDHLNAMKANSLFKRIGDLNNASPQDIALLKNELGKISTGGKAGSQELQALDPGTFSEKFAKVAGSFMNEPTAANAGPFLQKYKDYINDLDNNAKSIINTKIGRVLETRKKSLGEDNFNMFKQQYMPGELSQSSQNLESKHPEDSDAVKWAKANPKDPRAAQILKVNGIQ